MNAGYSFRGRPMAWDPDKRAIEDERQKWVYERINNENDLIISLAVDPDQAYKQHVDAYVETGDETQLRLALEYVR